MSPCFRLPGSLEQGDIRYAYDANGNRSKAEIGKTRHSYQYAKGSNRITAIDGQALEYDKAGRLIQDPRFTYRYDTRGRLAQVTDNSGMIAAYAYNEKGLRVRKTLRPGTAKVETTWFAYDPQGHLIAEYAATHNEEPRLTREYLWLGDTPIALIDHASTASDIYFIHADHLNTPKIVTDSQGREVWRWDSTPFGLGKLDEDPDGDGHALTLNLRFPGQYYDIETGLHYNYFRTYDPNTGRYITSDQIGLRAGPNTYKYVNANPINSVDPKGLLTPLGVGIGAACIAATGASTISSLNEITKILERVNKIKEEIKELENSCPINDAARALLAERIRDLKLERAAEQARLVAPGLATAGIVVVGGVVCSVLAGAL